MAIFSATFPNGDETVFNCPLLSDGLKEAGEQRTPVSCTVQDGTGRQYPMTADGIVRAAVVAASEEVDPESW